MQIEVVKKGRCAVAMFIVINGERVAERGRDEFGQPAWLPLPGSSVSNIVDDLYQPDVLQ
jgi:hypothetical protein